MAGYVARFSLGAGESGMAPRGSPNPSTTAEVHVIPLGWELDRAVLPFESARGNPPVYHAHLFHLLSEGLEAGRGYPERVKARLERIAPVRSYSIQREDTATGRLIEFEQVLDLASHICARAIEKGDRVHINLSSGSKLFALAAGVVAMAHIRPNTGSVYYVRPEHYSLSKQEFDEHGLAVGMKRVQELNLIPLRLPEEAQLRVLSFLKHQHELRIEYRELLQFLGEIPGAGYEASGRDDARRAKRQNNALVTRMVRTLIAPLEKEGLVRVGKDGVARTVELLPNGRTYASLSAIDLPGLRKPLK
jgi:hypothetical protein